MWPPVFSEILGLQHTQAFVVDERERESRDQELRDGRTRRGLSVLTPWGLLKERLKSQYHC